MTRLFPMSALRNKCKQRENSFITTNQSHARHSKISLLPPLHPLVLEMEYYWDAGHELSSSFACEKNTWSTLKDRWMHTLTNTRIFTFEIQDSTHLRNKKLKFTANIFYNNRVCIKKKTHTVLSTDTKGQSFNQKS